MKCRLFRYLPVVFTYVDIVDICNPVWQGVLFRQMIYPNSSTSGAALSPHMHHTMERFLTEVRTAVNR